MPFGRKPGLAAASGGMALSVAASDAPSMLRNRADFVCDGSGDEVQIQAAIDALPTQGGVISLTSGTFNIDAVVNVNKAGMILRGAGKALNSTTGGTQIKRTTAGAFYVFDCTARMPVFEDLAIINLSGVAATVELVRFTTGCVTPFMRRCNIDNDVSTEGALLLGVNTTLSLEQCFVGGGDDAIQMTTGTLEAIDTTIRSSSAWCIDATSGVIRLLRCDLQAGAGGLRFTTSGYLYAFNNKIVAFGDDAVQVITSASAECVVLNNYLSADVGGDGLSVDATAGGSPVRIQDNHVNGAGQNGIKLTAVEDGLIQGNKIDFAGSQTDDTYSGIILVSACDRNSVVGNHVRTTTANKLKYGIRIDNANCDDNLVTNNLLKGASKTGGNEFVDAGTGTTAADNKI